MAFKMKGPSVQAGTSAHRSALKEIGDSLEKMNRRGLEYRKQQEAEAGEKQQVANVQKAPVDAETQDLMDQIKDVA